jgi:endonuclease I
MKKVILLTNLVVLSFLSFGQTTLPTSWNFSTPGISTPPTGWTLALGTNGNLTYGFGIGDALAARLDATGENFVIQFTDKPGPLSYYLSPQNAGNAWGGIFDIQESTDGQSWSTMRSITSKATTTTNFNGGRYIDYPAITTRYIRFYYTQKLPGGSSDPAGGNMAVDSVWIQAAPAAPYPSIQVKVGAETLANGADLVVGNNSSTTIQIENKGTSDTLIIDSVLFEGIAAADFSVLDLPLKVGSNTNSSLNLLFNAAVNGSRKALMKIYSNDTTKNPFVLDLYAIGGSLATEPVSQPTNLVFTNLKPYGFEVNFTSPSQMPEHYIVIKKKGGPVNETPVDGQTYQKGDYIGGCQIEAILDSSFGLNPTYILANSNYHYAVFSFNGPAGFENYLTSSPIINSVTTPGKSYGNYYNGIDPSQPNFITSLSAKINPHDTIYYSNYISRMVNPWLARDTSGGRKTVTCVYSSFEHIYNEPFVWANGSNGGTLTREHTWPQSWMPSNVGNPDWPNAIGTNKELPEYNDLHNLFPAHQANANLKRSNNPFDEVVTPTYTSPTGFGILGKDSANRTAYEPRPEHKGNVARALFYMAVCYNGINGKSWVIPSNQNLALLRQWHQADPPDAFEIARNEFVAATQGNRNPFIDHPEWADRINFGNLSYIPMDTTAPKNPSILIFTPVATDIWSKGNSANISWDATDIDSVEILFSQDSLQTLEVISNSYPAANKSFNYSVPNNFSHPFGLVIIKDKASMAADTSVYFNLSIAIGLNTIQNRFDFEVYPNPTSDKVFLQFTNKTKNYSYQLFDAIGRKLNEGFISSNQELDMINLNSGVYWLRVESGEGIANKKLIKN